MDIEKLLFAYARAWVGLHAPSLKGWTQNRILDAFYLLPEPDISFKEWLDARGYAGPSPAVETPPAASNDVEEGPGWAIAKTEEGKKKIDRQIEKLKKLAEQTKAK
jgi:hypothetical protein